MWSFNNREIAIAAWLLLFLGYALLNAKLRLSIVRVLQSVFTKFIITTILLMALYLAGAVYGLLLLQMWDTSLLKDTIIWFLLSGMVISFKLASSSPGEVYFWRVIISNFRVVVLIEFIANMYAFLLAAEFIVFPLVLLVALVYAYSQEEEANLQAKKVTEGILVIVGLVLIIHGVANMVIEYGTSGNLDFLRGFLLPPSLTIVFIPFLYILVLYIAYDLVFMRLNIGPKKSKKLKRLARREIFSHCLLSLRKVRGTAGMNIYNLMNIQSEEDVEEMARAYKLFL